ncbi:VTT domain-containing protein [Polaribacter sp. Z022]|uniref:YqaA family protein n=1 Tax=Polaribacter sp. Z022 TaxID=2927125 RepID=UPI002022846F|nr:VTT domain-containing protein [Polaribacter sp. Z022]MCL7752207.1 VTT domain-containing protein [Polaribacter sp. Z022]
MSRITKRKRIKTKKERAKLMHSYYSRTGFYMFIWESLKKAFVPIVTVVIGLFLINRYVYNINEGLESITETFSRPGIFSFFFTSETLLGLIPPEIFIAWTKKTTEPILNLSILATLSYCGGLVSYFIGKTALKIETVKNYLEVKMAKHLKNSKKWGGFLILVGALLPVPFSISCTAAGMIKYPFKNVVLFGLFRFARFAIYAWAIFKVVD